MEIGKQLKEARAKSSLTQEQVAEKLFVSRQTISNWENEKSYPDIISIIKLSDLYSISLDELLKGDRKMMEHLDESTNVVKSNKKLTGAVIVNIVLLFSLLILGGLVPKNNMYLIAGIFSLAMIGTGFLLYQIIRRI